LLLQPIVADCRRSVESFGNVSGIVLIHAAGVAVNFLS